MEFNRTVWENDQEYMDIVSDIIHNKEFIKLDKITHHHFTTRYVHSIFVSYVSYTIAKERGLDYVSVARAGLLHDFFLEEREEIEAKGIGSHNAAHPKIALENAKKLTDLNDLEEDIILKHMFLCTFSLNIPKYRESYIVSFVDKYCSIAEVWTPTRNRTKELFNTLYAKISYSN